MKKKILIIFCIMIFVMSGCAEKDEKTTKTGFYFDTVITITLYGEDSKYIEDCFDLCEKYDLLFDKNNSQSEIYTINHQDKPVKVSEDMLEIINKGIYFGDLSNGRFDITLGNVCDLWDFKSDSPTIPDKKDIEESISNCDYKNIIINGNEISLKNKDCQIDLGGIAKGFVADKLKQYLVSKGVKHGIIDLGGNILLIGKKTDGNNYNIGVKKPFTSDTCGVVNLADSSVVTSGIYERYFKKDNRIYHHILDSNIGYPVENNLLSVTIISKESVVGDGLSTTCFVLGLDDGLKLIEKLDGVEAIFVDSDYSLHYSSGLDVDDKDLSYIKLKS